LEAEVIKKSLYFFFLAPLKFPTVLRFDTRFSESAMFKEKFSDNILLPIAKKNQNKFFGLFFFFLSFFFCNRKLRYKLV